MATLPTRLVEVEFTAGVWTDIAADVVQVVTRRGRNRELGAFETGTMAITVRNDGRKYDPDNSAGPYYGNLRPNRRVRFRATYSLTFPIFQGYIDRITQVYGGPNDATAVIEVSDLFKLLQRAELPTSAYVAEVLADNPVNLWRLDEPLGATVAKDAMGRLDLDVYGSPGFGAASLISREPATAMTITDRTLAAVWKANAPVPVTGPPLTLEVVAQKIPAADDGLWVGIVPQPITQGAVWIQAAGTVVAFQTVNGSNSQVLATTTGVNLDDGLPHHIAATWDAAGTIKIYVDGVDRTSGSPTNANVAFTAARGIVTAAGAPSGSGAGLPNEGTSQMAAIYNTALSSTRIAAHAAQRTTPWNGDLTGARLTRILNLSSVPVADRAIDAGNTALQSTDLGGTVLGYAQKIEETEAGRLFVAADGKLTFLSRQNAETGTYLTSQATLVDADSGAGRGYVVTSHDVDEATVVTRATVSRADSVAVVYKDTAAVTEFGLIDETHDGLLHNSDDYSQAYAEWIVSTHKTPTTRVGAVTLELASDPANMYPDIFGLELGDRVTYKRTPQNTGATITLPMRVEAIAHETGGGYWRTTLQLSPFNLGTGGYGTGVWDTSLWDQAVWGF